MKRKPPSQGTCLAMAIFWWENKRPERSWDWLFCWGFYEMYVEGWFE